MAIDLEGRLAIVTGGGRGIGEAIATSLAEAGADVVVASRTPSELSATVDRVEACGVEGLAVETDLTREGDIETLVETTTVELGVPDVLVNNAGAITPAPPTELNPEDLETMLAVNVRGLFLLTRTFARTFRNAGGRDGRIVNVASLAARAGIPALTAYGGTKAGVAGLTRGFAAALAPEITVNSVSPGLTRVERVEDVIADRGEELFDFERLPMGRPADPGEVAGAVLFLASDLATYVTGVDLPVDGGASVTTGLYK